MSGKIDISGRLTVILFVVIFGFPGVCFSQENQSAIDLFFTDTHAKVLNFYLNNTFTTQFCKEETIKKYFTEPMYVYFSESRTLPDEIKHNIIDFAGKYYKWKNAVFNLVQETPDTLFTQNFYRNNQYLFVDEPVMSYYCAVVNNSNKDDIKKATVRLQELFSSGDKKFQKSLGENISVSYEENIKMMTGVNGYNKAPEFIAGQNTVIISDTSVTIIYLPTEIVPEKLISYDDAIEKYRSTFNDFFIDSVTRSFYSGIKSKAKPVFTEKYLSFSNGNSRLTESDTLVIVNDTMIIKVKDISLYQKVAPELTISPDTIIFSQNLCNNFIYPLFFDKSDYKKLSDSSEVIIFQNLHLWNNYYQDYINLQNQGIKITDTEIADYYHNHVSDYSSPSEASYLIVVLNDTSQSTIEQAYHDCEIISVKPDLETVKEIKPAYSITFEPMGELRKYNDFYNIISSGEEGGFYRTIVNKKNLAIYIVEKTEPVIYPLETVKEIIQSSIYQNKCSEIRDKISANSEKTYNLIIKNQ